MKILEKVPEYIRSLIPYAPGKPIEEVERELGIVGSVKLASNENPLGPSPLAIKALSRRLGELHRYPDGNCFYLTAGLAKKLGISSDELIFGNGSNELIELAVRAFLRPGDEAVMAEQAFVVYRLVGQAAGALCKTIPMKNFCHDLEAMGEAITPKTRVVFLANPNNPTGTIYGKGEWDAFFRKVPPEVLLIVDEAYFEYVTDPDFPNALEYVNRGRPIFVLRTFSKLYGLAGLRIGYGIGDREIIGMMHRVRQPFNVNAAAQWAALAAIEDGDHVRRTVKINREGMLYLQTELDRLGYGTVPSQANFLLVRVGNGPSVYDNLLRRGVIVRPMKEYGIPEYIRVTVGKPEENEKLITSLKEISQDQSKFLEAR